MAHKSLKVKENLIDRPKSRAGPPLLHGGYNKDHCK